MDIWTSVWNSDFQDAEPAVLDEVLAAGGHSPKWIHDFVPEFSAENLREAIRPMTVKAVAWDASSLLALPKRWWVDGPGSFMDSGCEVRQGAGYVGFRAKSGRELQATGHCVDHLEIWR